ncbi:MAG: response regulator, partial [Verrucomicrobiota bacterium]
MQTILVVDPDPDFLGWAQRHLEAPSARVIAAQDGEEALELFASAKPDLIIADSVIGPFGGMGLLQRIRHQDPNAFVILTSGFPSTTAIIEGMKYGAYEFLRKETLSFDLRTVVEGALKAKEAVEAAERRSKTPAPEANRQPRDEIIGSSPAMQDVFKMIG